MQCAKAAWLGRFENERQLNFRHMGGSWRLTFAWCYFPFHKILHRRGKEKTFLTIWTKLIYTCVWNMKPCQGGAEQDSLNHRPDVWMFCKHQMLSNSRRVLWLTLGPHAYRVFSIYFITKTRLSWLFIHIVCTFIIIICMFPGAILSPPESAPIRSPSGVMVGGDR